MVQVVPVASVVPLVPVVPVVLVLVLIFVAVIKVICNDSTGFYEGCGYWFGCLGFKQKQRNYLEQLSSLPEPS